MCCHVLCQVSVGDVIHCSGVAGKVAACLLQGATLLVLVDTMVKRQTVATGSDLWDLDGGRQLWRADHIEQCLAWHEEPDGALMVVRM
jgi:hypothetical protein